MVLILGWGHQPERLQAGLQIIIYTVCGSLPMLVLLCGFWLKVGSDNILLFRVGNGVVNEDVFVF